MDTTCTDAAQIERAKATRAWRDAEAFGVDMTQLIERLRLTPTERADLHQKALTLVTELRAAHPWGESETEDWP